MLAALRSVLVEPPINLLIVVIAGLLLRAGAGRRSWRRRAGAVLAHVGFLLLFVLALPVTGWLMLTTLERDLPLDPRAAQPPQAIVILAANDLAALPGGIVGPPDVGAMTLERVRAGALLQRRTGLPILVTGGSLRPNAPPVAAAMARVLRDDFAAQVRWVEDRSTTTWENARFSAPLLAADGITSVYLVTHAWHMRRGILSFRRFGVTVTAAPTHFTAPAVPNAGAFVPSLKGWADSGHALHEWIGLMWYRLGR
jgi:uncharacterized SAM-binding protein YcdF (DUF218 family)